MTTTKNDLVFAEGAKGDFGDVSVPDEAFEPKNARVRISIMIPGDVLERVREVAAQEQKKYQTLINDLLRAAVMDDDLTTVREFKIAALELARRSGRLEKRAENLEKIIASHVGTAPVKKPKRAAHKT